MGCSTLSIIMPNYNYGHYIGDAIEAITSQSLRPCEVIIVDDGSTDDSVAVIEQFVKRDSIVRLLRNGRNMGVVFAANRGLEHATGDYVYFASADDRVLPGLFEKSMDLLAQFPEAGLCCSDFLYLKEPEGHIREQKFRLSAKPRYFPSYKFVELLRKRHFPIGGVTILMKRKALQEIGGFNHNLAWQCDWFVDFVVGFRYGICYIPETLAISRLHPKSNSIIQNRESSAQRCILDYMFSLLRSPEFIDVLYCFRVSGILSRFKLGVLISLLLRQAQYRDFLTPLLLRRVLWLRALSIINPFTPMAIKDVYNRIYYRKSIKPGE